MKNELANSLLIGMIAASMLGPWANAGEADQDGKGQLQEIIVTATKRGDANAQSVPISISAYSGEQLETYGIENLNEIDLRTPGLVFTNSSGYQQPFIRGIGADYPGIGLEPPVSVYIDDVYWQRAVGGNYDLVDLKSLEVLKGPQGTLYGRNATGGAILLDTNDPTHKDEGSATLEGGSLGHQRADLILNWAISDRLAARIAMRFNDQDGYLKNPVTGIDYGGFQSKTVRAKIDYSGDAFNVMLTLGYAEQIGRPGLRQAVPLAPGLCAVCAITGATPPAGAYNTYQGDEAGRAGNHAADANLKITGDFAHLTFTSITAGRGTGFHSGTDEGGYAGAPAPYALDIETANNVSNSGNDLIQEFRLASHYSIPLNFLAGLDGQYSDEHNNYEISGAAFATDPGALLDTQPTLYTYSVSPWGELYYDITSQLKFTVGGRYNSDRKDATVLVEGGAFGPAFRLDDKWTNFTPRAVLAYSPDNTQNYYVSYSTGFKSGGYNFPAFSNSPQNILQPETIKSYEIGAKNAFLDRRLQTAAAVFYYDYKNIQVAHVLNGAEVKQNAGAAETYGVELDAQFAATDRLTLGGGYAFLHARFTSYANASVFTPNAAATANASGVYTPNAAATGFVTTTENLDGAPLTRSPDNTAYTSGTYAFPVFTNWKASVTGIVRYTSQYDLNPGRGGTLGLDYQKAYALANFSGAIGPDDGRYKIGFYVNNATNKLYYEVINTGNLGVYRAPAEPRTYGANVTINF
jgi:iron complex outermembrane recepter protein